MASHSAVNGPVKNARKGGSVKYIRLSVAVDWLA